MSTLHRQAEGVLVLYNDSPSLIKGEPEDLLSERGVVACARQVAQALSAAGVNAVLLPLRGNVEDALQPYPPAEWLIFNLAEGLAGRLFEEARIAWVLEAAGYTFTGSTGEVLARSTHKAVAKATLQQAGVPTPPGRVLTDPATTPTALPFPLIVKPVAEDASLGIGPDAVVQDRTHLRRRVAYIRERYRQAALVEAFLPGREFNVAVWGHPPTALPLAEVVFQGMDNPCDRFLSYGAKWQPDSAAYRQTPVVCPADLPADLAARIKAVALRAWEAIGCRDYARVDIRLDQEGTPNVLEVNCNPDLSAEAGFARSAQAGGYSYGEMLLYILEEARRRWQR